MWYIGSLYFIKNLPSATKYFFLRLIFKLRADYCITLDGKRFYSLNIFSFKIARHTEHLPKTGPEKRGSWEIKFYSIDFCLT